MQTIASAPGRVAYLTGTRWVAGLDGCGQKPHSFSRLGEKALRPAKSRCACSARQAAISCGYASPYDSAIFTIGSGFSNRLAAFDVFDDHVARQVAGALRSRFPASDAVSIYDTSWRGLPDAPLLETLDREGWTLVSRDVNTLPEFIKARLAEGLTHGGVIYADSKRLRQSDVRGLVRRLIALVEKHGDEDWTCREGWL